MIKKIMVFVLIITFSFVGCGKQAGIDGKPAARTLENILNDQIHYFDEEAVALADKSDEVASLRSEALRAYNLVNDERERVGLKPLIWDSNLESTANVRAMECSQEFSHTRPNGSPWYTVNSDIMGGENLAFGYESANEVIRGWMGSASHRENILYISFDKIAISIYVDDDGVWYWSQEFGY